ncbi:MAG: hypothetical protein GYB68_15765 [Chloroflexi bacterium]|nr:hypothetical protein [Chloroflexota bacterium]
MQFITERLQALPWAVILAWALRIALVGFAVEATSHMPQYVVTGEPRPVETEHPITCVHTRLTDEVEEWKIQRTLSLVNEMGATTIVEFFPWAYMEGAAKGDYYWDHADMVIEHARAQGLTIIARIGLVPEWARPERTTGQADTTLNHLDPENYQDLADFVAVFAERYQDEIQHIIIWNEPNLAFEWGFRPVDPAEYAHMLSVVYPAAKRGNPDVQILGLALAPTLEPVGSQHGMNDLAYLEQFYQAGGGEYMDALAVHTYGFKFPPDDPPAPEVLNFRRAELLHAVMLEYAQAETPVYITETGWNDHPRWTRAVRPGQRISYTIDALAYAEENWPWAESLCIWVFRTPRPTFSYPDYFTLVTTDFVPKPIYFELQAWARGWTANQTNP